MPLPVPNLDDRDFQQLVDAAKRHVQQSCPEWTDHNVSDPGVTLIEAFAQMVDQLIYRLNRVPERNYVKFLELIGVRLRPPAAARGEVTFWLSAPQPQPVLVRAGTEVATARTDVSDPIVFTTVADLIVPPCFAARVAGQPAGEQAVEGTDVLTAGDGFRPFTSTPVVGDVFLVGLSAAVPAGAVLLRLDCAVAGIGVDPLRPPLAWEAWTGHGWTPCRVELDETGGLNRPGDVLLHLPVDHEESVLVRHRCGWLRCRVTPADPGQPTYSESPLIRAVTASTLGATVGVIHAELIRDELLGTSDGTPAQRFGLQRGPVLPGDSPGTLQIIDAHGCRDWQPVEHFADSGPADPHYRLDPVAAQLEFGPAVRRGDGTFVCHGAIPAKGAQLFVPAYRVGGGRVGNVTAGQIRVLKTSVPYVARVENRAACTGGSDGETVEEAKVRGPMLLRHRGRAVTAADFVELTRDVAPELARVHCLSATAPEEAGGVRLLVIPQLPDGELDRITPADLVPTERTLARVAEHLDRRRLIGTRLMIEPPAYRALTVVVSLAATADGPGPAALQNAVLRALHRHLHPLHGGLAGTGWPFGRAVQPAEIHAVLAGVPGVDLTRELTVVLYPADPVTGDRTTPVERLELAPNELVLSRDHQVQVRR
jgi:predicted phage baseplate assembly protein